MSGACSTYGRQKIKDRILVGRTEGRRPIARRRCIGTIILKRIIKKLNGGMD
jgi:hypothetical protein